MINYLLEGAFMPFKKALFLIVALLSHLPEAGALAQGDPVNGKRQFGRSCLSCHSPMQGEIRVGPALFGVVGRQSGTVSNFTYSRSYVDAGARGLVWRGAELDGFLVNPKAFLSTFLQQPNAPTRMTLKTPDPQIRADIIAYLSTLTAFPNFIVAPPAR